MSNRAVPSPYQAEWARPNFEASVPGPLSSLAFPSQCRVELAWVDIESCKPWLMSSRWARADIEPNGPKPMSSLLGPMSSGAGLGQCRIDWARANVEPNKRGSMSILPGPVRC
ncbi:hypothetical protein PHAVU_009G059300 [Phaseolus vulgaris]|uniref:Uncharacterized protein n=1 Tax=Phaseolus vulgaris TaxID=3885 RepID=V7AVH8_PHAVU|nr:hypothetical protein PHAVU_009G059300g [Phaseolus vulgaris]ESW08603.1 hypothetical protein PHAVU_009G059300g [Phaseolus vulgaris]